MMFGTDEIVRGDAAFLNSVSRTALAALTLGLALGVALPGEARAGCVVNPVQSVTYDLSCSPITFGSTTNINAVGPSTTGVYGGPSMPWNVANYGIIQGGFQGI